ncbi:MAG: hypothetical protein ACK4QL_06995 [Pseudanabaenaceae cyanobacterium]
MSARRQLLVLLLLQVDMLAVYAQGRQPQATASQRQLYLRQQQEKLNASHFDLTVYPLTAKNQTHWQEVLWVVAVLEPELDYVQAALAQILQSALNPNLQTHAYTLVRSALQLTNQLVLHRPQFYQPLQLSLQTIATNSPHPEFVSMAVTTLYHSGADRNFIYQVLGSFPKRFPNWAANLFLFTTVEHLSFRMSNPPLPPLLDLLQWQLAPQQPMLYVFCRSDRQQLCFTLLKDKNGKFVRSGEQLWSVPLLLQSLYSLEWNFYNGRTPQGIYRIEGIIPQPDDKFFRAYGQFPLIKLFLPFETGVKYFLSGQEGAFRGNLAEYQQLLPVSWRNYFPIQQSYWAGKLGRSLFRIHGSGEDPNYFQRLHPDRREWNPTLGCLASLEIYDSEGNLVQADMPKILGALAEHGNPEITGYVVVIEVPPQVTLESVNELIVQWKL